MVPRHIGFIMDGNGRWAALRGLPREAGYAEGLKAMMKVIARLAERGVEAVTVYAYSSENFARPSSETAAILSVVTGWNTAYDGNMKVTYMGDFSRFPQAVADSIAEVERRTAANTGMRLNIALGYGGRDDIVRAAAAAARRGEITRQTFESELSSSTLPPLDLIVRSGGEKRLSGFMLYEAAYSELLFSDKLWPDMTEEDADGALDEFARRTRKFGA